MNHTGMPRGSADRAEDSPSAVTLWIARCAVVAIFLTVFVSLNVLALRAVGW